MVKTRQKKESKFKSTLDFFKQNLQDIVVEEKYLEDPIGGLEPIGDTGLYRTPDEPADPTDCDRYPNSIYCGGNPFTKTPIGIEAEIVLNKCDIGIKLTPTLGFVILPEFNLIYRKPECRRKPPARKVAPEFSTHPYVPPCFGSTRNRVMAIVSPIKYYGYLSDFTGEDNPPMEIERTDNMEILSYEYPYKGGLQYCYVPTGFYGFNSPAGVNTVLEQPLMHLKIKTTTNIKSNDRYSEVLDITSTVYGYSYPYVGIQQPSYDGSIIVDLYLSQRTLIEIGTSITPLTFNRDAIIPVPSGLTVSETLNFNTGIFIFIGRCDLVADRIALISAGREYISNIQTYPKYVETAYETIYKYLDDLDLPPPKEKCCMGCCPPKDDTLTKLLLKEVRKLSEKVVKLSEVVGIDEFPASVPESLISKDEGFIGNLIPNNNKSIPNLTQFLIWYVERFDEIMGQWEIPIEIKDSDPSKPGDQPLGVKLPNMAEAIAEIFTLAFQTNLNSETLLNFAVRTAVETVTDKQQNFITYKLLQSMAEWAGYKQKDIKLKMPILFSLGKTRYDEILKESDIDVPCVDFDEKFGLEADLMRFREAVAILQANYKQKVDPNGDIKGQILKHLLDTFATVNKVNGEDDDKDFEKFLTEVEEGFTKTSGATNTTEPYGRPYNQRPKIRDLTKNNPPTTP